ncbi:hypothetical protein [Burkholderia sp. Ac-20379]|uniref:hypothetical protein n=1 Tax=Burkholderia sp. Ac-20379 TaxID=2703900 RepID=UPI0019811A04|nr:hypothetical protein [Burkholderia sp. Ac-20379]MBN3726950.1 hypothetical protein [Burkholderia sp. Ac-20379]
MMRAYHDDAALKAAVLERLTASAESGELRPGPFAWHGDGGSAAGCVLRDADPGACPRVLGLPAWLALAIDHLSAMQASPEAAAEIARQLFEAVPVGADLRTLGSEMMGALLARLAQALPAGEAPHLAQLLDDVAAAHAAHANGGAVSPAAWKALRRTAVELTDATPGEGFAAAIAAGVEAAAWDPDRSPAALTDTLRALAGVCDLQALRAFGWTEDDDTRVKAALDDIYRRHLAGKPEDTRTVFEIYAIEAPADEARLRERMRVGRSGVREATRWTSERLLALLARYAAPAKA